MCFTTVYDNDDDNTTIPQAQGAMPYNMTSFQPVRDLLREIGGEEAAKTMPTPTFSVCVNEKGQMFVRVTAGEVRRGVLSFCQWFGSWGRVVLPCCSAGPEEPFHVRTNTPTVYAA